MGIRVRYIPMELTGSETEYFAEADKFVILEDNTVQLRQWTNYEERKYRIVGYINKHKWQSVFVVDENVSPNTIEEAEA